MNLTEREWVYACVLYAEFKLSLDSSDVLEITEFLGKFPILLLSLK